MKPTLAATSAALAFLAVAAAATAASAQNGSFRGSCRNVTSLGGGTVSAECADSGGRYRSSTLAAGQCQGDIGNQNGMLACNGAVAQGGAYVPDPKRNNDNNRDRNAGSGRGGYDDGGGYGNNGYGGGRNNSGYGGGYGDRNDNRGNDRGDSFRSNGAVVAGSYQSSCRSAATIQGGYLSAECMDNGGRYRQSSIQYTACRGDIANQNGMLACPGAVASGGAYSR